MRLVGRTAIEIAEAVRSKQAKPTEVVEAHLEQVKKLEPKLRAFETVRAEKAAAEAKTLESRRDLRSLPLAGVPVAIKSSVAVAGEPGLLGTKSLEHKPAEADDEIVRRLRAAGAIILGVTHQPELALWHFTENAFGVTRNPWDLSRGPGGSSGGSGAAVAAAEVAVAQASDGGGSIRIPAAWNGLFGIKPGPGVVPVAGGLEEHWFGLSQWGPLATTVADGALMLDVMAGTDRYRDPQPRQGLRIALSMRPPLLGVRVDKAIRLAVEAAADALREAGHTVIVADPPYNPNIGLSYLHRCFAGAAIEVDLLGMREEDLEPRSRRAVRWGRYFLKRRPVPAGDSPWAARMTAWFADYDVMLSPTTSQPGVRADGWMGKSLLATVNNGSNNTTFTQAWNVASFPAASVPVGLTESGFPIGAQVVAPRGGEATVLSVARELEQLRPWPRHAPLAGV